MRKERNKTKQKPCKHFSCNILVIFIFKNLNILLDPKFNESKICAKKANVFLLP